MREGQRQLALARLAACVVVALALAAPAAAQPTDGLVLADRVTGSRAEVERAVAEIERAPSTTPYLDEALRKAARASEDVLADPARALALYERILREFPDAGTSRLARVRAELLREQIGAGNAHAAEAAELAALRTGADRTPAADMIRRADALAARDWPGAPDAALFLAEWLQRTGRITEADARYTAIVERWPGTPQAQTAARGATLTAILEHDWTRAEARARALPAIDETDRVLREELLDKIARGRQFDFWYRVAWIVLVLAVLALVVSLLDAALRGGWRRPSLRPPVEVLFLVPIGAVLIGVALTTHYALAPAVTVLTFGGLALAWISGITLDLLRLHRRPVGARGAVHVVLCLGAVAALLYIVLTHDNLLEMMIETVRFGPDP